MSQTVSGVTLYAEAGGGGGSRRRSGRPVGVGVFRRRRIELVTGHLTGSILNPLTNPLSTSWTSGSGTVTIQGFNSNLSAERSSAVGGSSW